MRKVFISQPWIEREDLSECEIDDSCFMRESESMSGLMGRADEGSGPYSGSTGLFWYQNPHCSLNTSRINTVPTLSTDLFFLSTMLPAGLFLRDSHGS